MSDDKDVTHPSAAIAVEGVLDDIVELAGSLRANGILRAMYAAGDRYRRMRDERDAAVAALADAEARVEKRLRATMAPLDCGMSDEAFCGPPVCVRHVRARLLALTESP